MNEEKKILKVKLSEVERGKKNLLHPLARVLN